MRGVILCFFVGIVLFSQNVSTFSFEGTINHVLKNKLLNNKTAEEIDLSSHGITEISIEDFKDMHNLKFLNMKKNSIHLLQVGTFRDTYMLNKLDLSYNEINELSGGIFANLTFMKSLILNNNFITVIEKDVFSHMKSLTMLRIDDNRISHLDADIFRSNTKLDELDLSFNYIHALDQNIFKNLTKIRKLSIDNNKINHISKQVFSHLRCLEHLNLSNNILKHLDVDVFQNNVKLDHLWLSGNQISILEYDMFANLSNLIALYLNNNMLKHIGRNVFQHCNALETLDLGGNKLQSLDNAKIEKFDERNNFILYENPWICNYSLRPIFAVWRKTGSISPVCYEPQGLENKAWSTLNESDFECDSYTTIKHSDITEHYNENITTNTECDKTCCVVFVCFSILITLILCIIAWIFPKNGQKCFSILTGSQQLRIQMKISNTREKCEGCRNILE